MKHISILGSTGSIGTQTLDVIRHFPEKFCILGLSAGRNIELLKQQIIEFSPQLVSVISEKDAQLIQKFIHSHNLKTDVTYGKSGLNTIASIPCSLLVVAIVGTTSLEPTYTAIQKGTPIGLACKEVLVSAGDIIMAEALKNNVPILPIDSEHAAIFQCLEGYKTKEVEKLILTASGGPFWDKDVDFSSITKKEALKHPNWTMGQKISIDSATLMNKGLEVIEAHHLFNIPYEQIEVVIHPQSIIHSLVEYIDGNVLAQLGNPDMRLPIQFVLTYPEKLTAPWPKTNFHTMQNLTFNKPDFEKFPLCKLAFDVGKMGSTYPVVMNAANEVAVNMFLKEKISFCEIETTIRHEVETHAPLASPTIEDIIDLDNQIKNRVGHAIKS
jgi:1-deoxy-D-xylulose-5-phosphate reductoisomerase